MELGKSHYRLSDNRQENRLNLLTRKPDMQVREHAGPHAEPEAGNRELVRRLAELEAENRELTRRNAELRDRDAERTRENAYLAAKLKEWTQRYEDWNEWMESAKISSLFLDMELRIKQFNTPMTRQLQLSSADIDRPFGELDHERLDDRLYADVVAVADSLIPLERELRSQTGHWYNLVILPYGLANKQPRGIVVTLTEITDLKRTAAELQKLSYAVEQSHSIILITDTEGIIEYANLKFFEHTGYIQEEVLGRPVADLHPEEIGGRPFREVWEEVSSGNRWAGEIEMGRKEGDPFWEGASLLPIKNKEGEIIHVLKMSQNITEHKTAEELLRKSEMLSAIGQLAAGVAHEIRNPLTALKGFTKLLERGMTNKAYTRIMSGELERIETIINEFLVLAKPQVWSFQKKNVADILKDVLLLLEPEAHLENVEFITCFDPRMKPISCVENQLKQVFLNILKNSLEAVQQGGVIRVEAGMDQDEQVFVRIEDNGCGIPEEKLARLGEPFYSTKEKGTGLGLMVSFKIIENHRGSYFVKSEPNCGTAMEIRLPLDR